MFVRLIKMGGRNQLHWEIRRLGFLMGIGGKYWLIGIWKIVLYKGGNRFKEQSKLIIF